MFERLPAALAGILSGIFVFLNVLVCQIRPNFSDVQFDFSQSQVPLSYMSPTNIINTNNKYFTTSAFSTQCGKLLSSVLSHIMLAPANPVRR